MPVRIEAQALALLRDGLSARAVGRRVGVHGTTVGRWAKVAGMDLRVGRHGGLYGGLVTPAVTTRGCAAAGAFTGGAFAGGAFARGAGDRAAGDGAGDGSTRDDWVDARGCLTGPARGWIQAQLEAGASLTVIATELGVHRSTIHREVKRGSVDGRYRAGWSQERAQDATARPKTGKLVPGTKLWDAVIERLNKKWSPEQVSQDLRRSLPDREDMQVSHETIYQALYVQGKGSLREELTVVKALRTGRTTRRPHSKLPSRRGDKPWIGDGDKITDRPAEVADRAVPGHWEADLVMGAGNKTAVLTVAERSTRYVLIRRLPLDHTAPTVAEALIEAMRDLPEGLRRSVTYDQGSEMADHKRFTLATDCKVYFCDPHSPWQRGTNENTNGLIRDFYPKGTDFAQVSDEDIAHTEHLLNTRPRKTLGWETPADKLQALLDVAPTV